LNISRLFVPYIGPASHRIERILRNEAGIKVYHFSKNKLFQALCTHKDSVNESQKPGVYCIPCECGLVYIGETGRNLSVRLQEHKTNCEKAEQDKSAVAKHTWTYDHCIKWDKATILAVDSHKFSRKMREGHSIVTDITFRDHFTTFSYCSSKSNNYMCLIFRYIVPLGTTF
jgi:predicted GIY-YIG superfamily endonuclease